MAEESDMNRSFGQDTMALNGQTKEHTVFPPITEVKPGQQSMAAQNSEQGNVEAQNSVQQSREAKKSDQQHVETQKTSLTCSSGLKDDDIEMDHRTPDVLSDVDIMDSVLHDLDADGMERESTFQTHRSAYTRNEERRVSHVHFDQPTPQPPPPKPAGRKWVSREVQLDADDDFADEFVCPTVVAPPPMGHGYDFYATVRKHGKNKDKDEYFPDQELELLNQQKLIAKVIASVAPKPKLLPSRKDNRDNTRRGLRFIDMISKVPLSTVWHRTTQILAMIVFIVNVIVAFYDIVRDFKYLYYKVPAFILTFLENVILLIMWLVLKSKRFQAQGERSLKHQQYIENIVHEVLMYPLLAMAAFGFGTEKMYQEPSDAFGWAQLILLVIDVIELIWTQIVRLKMTYSVFGDIDSVVYDNNAASKTGKKSRGMFSWRIAGWVLMRTYITTMGNILTFLVLLAMLILQVHYDNFTSGDYRITWRSGLILLCFIALPLYSVLVYILANAFWVMEILLQVNIRVGSGGDFHGELAKQYGALVSDALTFTMSKVQSNEERLMELKGTPLGKKIVYGAIEPLNACLLVIWQVLVVTSIAVFFPDNNATVTLVLKIAFGLLLLLANWHVFIVAVVADVVVAGLILGTLFYPFSIVICCKNTQTVDPQEEENYKYF